MLVQQSQGERTHESEVSRQQKRAGRILDAAATVILRWGYHKATLDDISRKAGVAKATIYLHWKTREELFGALITREKLAMVVEIKQRIAVDPVGATLGGILKHSALALMKRPLMKAVLLRDMDVLGKLAQSQYSSAAYTERMESFKIYLELLREHGLVRTDLSLKAQVYLFCAIFVGFFLVAPLMPEGYTLADEELAELMAEAARCTLEPARAAPSEELESASHAFVEYLDRRTVVAQEQVQREGLPPVP